MARPIWKGSISFGLVNIPVTLLGAEKSFDLHFHLLDARNHARVRYQRVNEATGEEVPWDQIVKAHETQDGELIVLTDEDFKRAAVEAVQTIEIQDFVELKRIPYTYYDKPYYLSPGKKGEKGYVLLRETLRRTGRVGIAKVVLRTKQYLAAVIAEGDALLLELLRFDQELRQPSEFEFPGADLERYKVSLREIEMAEHLVESMTADWKPEQYKDEYHDALIKWIETKAREGDKALPPAPAAAKEEAEVINMMDLLKRSVRESQKARGGGEAEPEREVEHETKTAESSEPKPAKRKTKPATQGASKPAKGAEKSRRPARPKTPAPAPEKRRRAAG